MNKTRGAWRRTRRTTIPNHPGTDIPKGTLKAIIKETGLTEEEFMAL
ncbi:MAG TPA: addiction module toxin, HicA family [Methanomicrobia archaeon]|nr:addiction module toxin, HicA family [Methanomicrobia archaeon]